MFKQTVHVFLSYTRREEEVSRLQPILDKYCDLLVRWARTHGVDIFYDRSAIPQGVEYSEKELKAMLEPAILKSHLLVSFLSPKYIQSKWCRFEYITKLAAASREIHNVYWKPEIAEPLFPWFARLHSPARTQFLMSILAWNRIRYGDKGYWRDTRFREWVSFDETEKPLNFSDVTDVYIRNLWAGPESIARCAQKSAVILCREHPTLFGGNFTDYGFFEN